MSDYRTAEAFRVLGLAGKEFTYSRRGDCQACGGSGRIEKYRHIEGGLCFTCKGTGGKRLPERAYHAFVRVTASDRIYEGATGTRGRYLGVVQKTGREWWAWGPDSLRGKMFKSRDEASVAIRKARRI